MAKILVIAPHPDDEALGAGGVIHRAVQAGNDVRVILMTAGDGFVQDAERYYLSLHVTPEEYLHLGYERQLESQRAMAHLGLSPEHVACLGFPDGGLDHLLLHYGDSLPFESQTTQQASVPYIHLPSYHTPYTGNHLLQLLIDELERFQPHWIVSPILVDQHPDHWATSAFATLALFQCQAKNLSWAQSAQQWGYLIHWTGWPLPLGYHPELGMEMPQALKAHPFITWYPQDDYAEQEIQNKRQALLSYDSQVELIKPFLQAFARRNEVLGKVLPLPWGTRVVLPRPKSVTLPKLIHKDFGLIGSTWWFDGEQMHVLLELSARPEWTIRLATFVITSDIQFFAAEIKNNVTSEAMKRIDTEHGTQLVWSPQNNVINGRALMGIVIYDEENKLIARTGFWPWQSLK
ncbi:PIG-L deacetylase family protein [Sulfobacillus thermosulfidooxidans]|uniref:PIG-L deacetylase family protein n=1 Tax=Sulfobacillus thermosulfidooxidans TaxID=28034 RepID=UPI0006B67D7F|nr:PIG-L family deacetylase [Sulfobacillus thermosulfidooxidans]